MGARGEVVGSLFISGSFFYYYRVDAIPDVDFRMRYDVIASRPCRVDFSCYEFSNYRKPVFPNSNSIRDSRPPEDSKEAFMIYEVKLSCSRLREKLCFAIIFVLRFLCHRFLVCFTNGVMRLNSPVNIKSW